MSSLHAEQTCQVDNTKLQDNGLALVQNPQGNECGTSNNFRLYSESSHNNAQKTTCELKCQVGWHLSQTPTMSCGDDTQNRNSASGVSSYTACTRTWYIYIVNDSHNGIVCPIGDLLW